MEQQRERMETECSAKQEEILQLVCFMFADEQYAVDITCVREVIRIQKITHVPQMPDFTTGVINIRGNILPVFDLRKKFGLKEKAFDGRTKMIVVDVDDSQICFVVDEILDNVKISVSSVVPAPNVKMKIKRECIWGIGKLEERMIIILDLRRLNESISEDIKTLPAGRQAMPAP
jgi:purine-binding chemotaxis protein CheW